MEIVEKVRQLVEEKVNEKGVNIDNIEYVKEGTNNFLRITIDKNDGVDLDTCIDITNVINPILDENDDIFTETYILDVTSKERGDNNG